MQRYRVAEDSMKPALAPGDEFVTTRSRSPLVGDVVSLPHPNRDDFWLVKRMGAGPGDTVDGHGTIADGMAWVTSDNHTVDGHDSRSFGPVTMASLEPRVEHLDHVTFVEALDLLAEEEPAFAQVIEEFGAPPFWNRPAGFPTLIWLIMEQQVSLESGAAMYRRLHGLLGAITPEAMSGVTEADLRAIGVTRQKSRYLMELAQSVLAGDLDLDGLVDVPLHKGRASLLSIKGVGPWTADVYLLSALKFPDVFPVGDRALQVGVAEVLGMISIPDESELEILSTPWRPIRAVAARIIWHSYLKRRGRAEPPDPTIAHATQ
jgi:DNA-3-methyladenine glycosylase II